MTTGRRILRLLLIVGLVPALAAAGLPLPICACEPVEAAKTCCCGGDSSCDRCPCKAARQRTAAANAQDPTNSGAPAVRGCACVSAPVPMVPGPALIPAIVFGLPAATDVAATTLAAVPRAVERHRSALLPTPDLPTTLRALVI